MNVLLGCIADDFTGGTDLCESLFLNGMRPIQLLSIPDRSFLGKMDNDVNALVISLKIRNSSPDKAVDWARKAFHTLRSFGCIQYYWKYCSTFDSTEQGNIGPVADMLVEELGARTTIVCPAYPNNGRTVYQAHLFVHDCLLEDTHMAQHPLTPMRQSDLRKLLSSQTGKGCGSIPLTTVRKGQEAVTQLWNDLAASGITYIVADAIDQCDLSFWGKFCLTHPLLTGGSGLAGAFASHMSKGHPRPSRDRFEEVFSQAAHLPLILSGSCSAATQEQIRFFAQQYPIHKLDPLCLLEDGQHMREALQFVRERRNRNEPALVYAANSPEEVQRAQQILGKETAGELMEQSLAAIAWQMRREGIRKFVVAGGETSGAVVQALEVEALRVGHSIAPGVPWVYEMGTEPLIFALKSGNFGGPDFFLRVV